jgi:hypothetical protein
VALLQHHVDVRPGLVAPLAERDDRVVGRHEHEADDEHEDADGEDRGDGGRAHRTGVFIVRAGR